MDFLSNHGSELLVLLGTVSGYLANMLQSHLKHRQAMKVEKLKLSYANKIEAYTSVLYACDSFFSSYDPTDYTTTEEVKHVYLSDFEKIRNHYAFLDRQVVSSVENLLEYFRAFLMKGHPDFDVSDAVKFVNRESYDEVLKLKKHVVKQLTKA